MCIRDSWVCLGGVDETNLVLKPEDQRSTENGEVNRDAVAALTLLSTVRQAKKIYDLENSPTWETPVTMNDLVKIDHHKLVDAVDDAAAAAAGVELDQVYRNGSMLMVRCD